MVARNGDGEDSGWMQILVFVVLAVFYALGGIAKAKANKLKKQEQDQDYPDQQTQHPSGRVLRSQPLSQVQPEIVEPLEVSEISPPIQPKRLEELPELTTGRDVKKPLKDKYIDIFATMAQEEYVSKLSADYDDPDKLKRAILHYEILGKPISLRE